MAVAMGSDTPFTNEQRIDRQSQQLAADLRVSADLRELYIHAINVFFSHHDREACGDTARVAITTLEDAFKLTLSMSESQVAFSQSALAEMLEVPSATH